jgi:hypothetical protein
MPWGTGPRPLLTASCRAPRPAKDSAKAPPPLKNPENYVGHSYRNEKGNTECVEFPKQVAGAASPAKEKWVPGDYISPENPPPEGTWVATFNENGDYDGHVGAFSHFDKDGNLYLYDQFNSKGKVTLQVYHHKPAGWGGHVSNNPANYRILEW